MEKLNLSRKRTKGAQPKITRKDIAISFDGIDMNQLVFMIPHARRLGLRLLEKEGDTLLIELPYNPELEGIPGTGLIANGAITTLLDTALGAAIYDQFETFQRIVTLDLRVDYFDKPKAYSNVLVKTRCLKKTDKIVFVQGDAYSGDEETPIAHAVAVFSYAEVPVSGKISSQTGEEVGQVS